MALRRVWDTALRRGEIRRVSVKARGWWELDWGVARRAIVRERVVFFIVSFILMDWERCGTSDNVLWEQEPWCGSWSSNSALFFGKRKWQLVDRVLSRPSATSTEILYNFTRCESKWHPFFFHIHTTSYQPNQTPNPATNTRRPQPQPPAASITLVRKLFTSPTHTKSQTMVYYFTTRCGNFTIYMGKDKYENESLIKYGLPEDCWFHVDDLSSAHGEYGLWNRAIKKLSVFNKF